ncbi:SDR family NAD(P)-dependent oxidoreductase [Agromyces silvae]|uniref:SDR family NAD(P)-dependent oxidoreductase n=1 Tax=Agromyces silvae TaxID=3388266 RepID=UPI00280BD253|nr:SDR family NAD(P)-dependent oxidoreductase [Agromyces protaetiae]
MLIDLTDRVVIVTGGAQGIGRDLVLRLAHEGAHVVAVDRNPTTLDALAADLEGAPASLRLQADVTSKEDMERVVAETVEAFGRVDVLVNNAGVGATAPTDLLDEAAWRRCLDVNVTGVFLASQAVIPVMKAQRSGRIINAASFAAIIPSVAHAAYGASKAAVAHFGRALAGELGPWGITVNSYAPGMVPTSLNGFTERSQADQDRLLSTLTLRRWGSTEDIGNLVCFLASEQAGYITGQLIDVSGGKFATQVPSVAYEYEASGDPATIL